LNGGELNAVWAGVFLDELARSGVREICVAPGSRSTPLVLAAARDARFRTLSVVDERSAGFLALGMGRASGRPAAVITTSGTAGANLYPAVIEACQGEVPLLVLTADRPHRLRDTDANQAMDQLRLFGIFPRAFMEVSPPLLSEEAFRHLRGQACRAVALAKGPPRGPVHLNFPFEKPLEPSEVRHIPPPRPEGISAETWEGREDGDAFVSSPTPHLDPGEEAVEELLGLLSNSRRGIIVTGPVPDPEVVGPAVRDLSAATGFPLLADPLSGGRYGPSGGARVITGYDLFLRSPAVRRALAPDLILRVGASPTSAPLLGFLEESGAARQVIADQGFRWKDHLGTGQRYLRASPGALLSRLVDSMAPRTEGSWGALWRQLEERTFSVVAEWEEDILLEGEILSALAERVPDGGSLLVASSMPIRDLDAFGASRSGDLSVYANRGTSGIDGLVSTTLGVAAVSPGLTVGALGDLAFLHDMNGLLAMKKTGISAGFVVVNNDGGGIFETLPVRTFEPAYTKLFATPHGLDLERVAELYEIPFARVDDRDGFLAALTRFVETGPPFLLEARTERVETHQARKRLVDRIVNVLEEVSLE